MKEYMLFIRNIQDHQDQWADEKHQQFLKACEAYIGQLKKENKLISAQPLVREGNMISGTKDNWKESAFSETKEVIVGYYHIRATDLNEAKAIAKMNPEFAFGSTAKVEVRPVKMKEQATGFVYPNS